jgi:hypothetical protein
MGVCVRSVGKGVWLGMSGRTGVVAMVRRTRKLAELRASKFGCRLFVCLLVRGTVFSPCTT